MIQDGEVIARPEQPNTNVMIIEQIEDCVKVGIGLLEKLSPKTEQADGSIIMLKFWRDTNLTHLPKAYK